MRIFAAGIATETNTFAPIPTALIPSAAQPRVELLLNGALGFVQEGRAEQALAALRQLGLKHAAPGSGKSLNGDFAKVLDQRRAEADEFYEDLAPSNLSDDARSVQRQAFESSSRHAMSV